MAFLLHDLPSDKVTGTWSATGGTVNPVYPLTNLDDDKPWNPTIYTANPTRLICDHATAKRLDLVSFLHCNFPAGYVPVVARGSVVGTPATTVTVVCAGAAEDSMPPNPFVDLTALAGGGNYRYTWIDLPATATLLSLGLIRLSSTKRFIPDSLSTFRDRDFGAKDREQHPTIEQQTDGGVQLGYSRGTRARWLSGSIRSDASGFAHLETWRRACRGRFKPCLLIPNADVNEALWVKWGSSAETPFDRVHVAPDVYDVPVEWEEVGRGLAP